MMHRILHSLSPSLETNVTAALQHKPITHNRGRTQEREAHLSKARPEPEPGASSLHEWVWITQHLSAGQEDKGGQTDGRIISSFVCFPDTHLSKSTHTNWQGQPPWCNSELRASKRAPTSGRPVRYLIAPSAALPRIDVSEWNAQLHSHRILADLFQLIFTWFNMLL